MPEIDELISLYKSGFSAISLAVRYGHSVWWVLSVLRGAGVEIRRNQNERRLASAGYVREFVEIVDGLLLGDGQIDPKGILHLEQSVVRAGWVQQVQEELRQVGASSKVLAIPPRVRTIENREIRSKPACHLYTPAYVELKEQRQRWYPPKIGKKRVPRDLRLTPKVLTHWLCGDGTAHQCKGITFCTNGFLEEDIDFLVRALRKEGIITCKGSTARKGQWVVNVHRKDDACKLRKLVEPLLPDCCFYKIAKIIPTKRLGRCSDEQVRSIRERSAAGEYQKDLAVEFGISQTMIWRIAHRKSYKKVD